MALSISGLASVTHRSNTWTVSLKQQSRLLSQFSSSNHLSRFQTKHRRRQFSANANVPPPGEATESDIRNLFHNWNKALATLDSSTVANMYAPDGLLLPTVSDTPRTNFALIKDYFDHFLLNKPQGEIIDGHIRIGNGWAKDAGIYEFSMGADNSKVKARYSFLYAYENNEWKIIHHHSSAMPEASKAAKPTITETEVRDIFVKWNAALGTCNSDTVAAKYGKNAVLLPTVSDTTRNTPALIKDYFDHFLQNKPQAEIVESYVTTGEGWFRDAGVYSFTMGIDGSKVKARYSFVYVFEDGEWKISHHQSSAMPEPLFAAVAKLKSLEKN